MPDRPWTLLVFFWNCHILAFRVSITAKKLSLKAKIQPTVCSDHFSNLSSLHWRPVWSPLVTPGSEPAGRSVMYLLVISSYNRENSLKSQTFKIIDPWRRMKINSIFEISKFKTFNFQKLIQLDKLFILLILITFLKQKLKVDLIIITMTIIDSGQYPYN